jgi:hypothetical protein
MEYLTTFAKKAFGVCSIDFVVCEEGPTAVGSTPVVKRIHVDWVSSSYRQESGCTSSLPL